MSLAVLADHLASKGRNGDTMLVHMTPEEVHGLHALALAHGGKLTVNPDTGLPEANFLKKLLPMIAGMALNFFAPGVGTAVGSLIGAGSAVGTGLVVGGITGLATGSLKQGIMAGLGAYGGASLAGGLEAAGSAAAGTPGVESITGSAAAQSQLAAANEAAIAMGGQPLTAAESQRLLYSTLSPADKFTSGISALTTEPGRAGFMSGVGGTSGLLKAGYGATMGMDALGQPKTTTPQGSYTYKPMIRPMAMGEGQTFEQLPMFSANTGGIVALAAGGASDPTQQGTPTAAQLAAQKSIEDDPQAAALAAAKSGVSRGLTDQQIAELVNQQYGKSFSAQNIADFLEANKIFRPGEIGVGAPAIDYTKAPTMGEIRSEYEKGGGSTGDQQIGTVLPGQNVYTQNTVVNALRDYMSRNPGASYDALKAEGERLGVPPPQLRAALNEYRFNSLTGGSGQAYDYLMGRGAYPSSPFIPAGGSISKPYAEAVGIVPTGFYAGRATSTAPSDMYTGRPGAGSGTGSGSTTTAPSGDPNEMVTWRNASTYETVRAPRSQYANDSNWQIVPGGADGGLAGLIPTKNMALGGLTPFFRRLIERRKAIDPSLVGVSYQDIYDDPARYGFSDPLIDVAKGSDQLAASNQAAMPSEIDLAFPQYMPGYQYRGGPSTPSTSEEPGVFDFLKNAYNILFVPNPNPGGVPVEDRTPGFTNPNAYSYDQGPGSPSVSYPETPTDLNYARDYAGEYSAGSGGSSKLDEVISDVENSKKAGGLLNLAAAAAAAAAHGGQVDRYNLGGYSDGGRLLRGPGDGVSDSIPATIGDRQPARLADGEFVVPARIVSELGNGSTEAGARKLYAMMDRVQRARAKTTGKNRVAHNTKAERYLPA